MTFIKLLTKYDFKQQKVGENGEKMTKFESAKYFNSEFERQGSFDECIGNYFESLPGLTQKRWYVTELQNRYYMGKSTINDDSLRLLQSSKRCQCVIKNFPNYNILENDIYADAMFYTKLEKRERPGEEETAH